MQWRNKVLCLAFEAFSWSQEEFRNIAICQATVGKPWGGGEAKSHILPICLNQEVRWDPSNQHQVTQTSRWWFGESALKSSKPQSSWITHTVGTSAVLSIKGQLHGRLQWHCFQSGFTVLFCFFGTFKVVVKCYHLLPVSYTKYPT